MELNQGKNSQKGINIDDTIIESFKMQLNVESQTIIHCKIKAFKLFKFGGWVNISPNTYLIHRDSDERLKLLYAENIPYTPYRYFFRTPHDCLYFTLIFQRIPETWTNFCLYEETQLGDGFFVGEVPKNKSGIYRIRIN